MNRYYYDWQENKGYEEIELQNLKVNNFRRESKKAVLLNKISKKRIRTYTLAS